LVEHIFDRVCRQHQIENRLTKPNHPRAKSQIERLNRNINDDTLTRFNYDDHTELRQHTDD
jgi:transposase InsO family protein